MLLHPWNGVSEQNRKYSIVRFSVEYLSLCSWKRGCDIFGWILFDQVPKKGSGLDFVSMKPFIVPIWVCSDTHLFCGSWQDDLVLG